jgi:hypothetical protein
MSRANEVSRGTLRDIPDLPDGWCCYLLLCSDGSYYCGITSKLPSSISPNLMCENFSAQSSLKFGTAYI